VRRIDQPLFDQLRERLRRLLQHRQQSFFAFVKLGGIGREILHEALPIGIDTAMMRGDPDFRRNVPQPRHAAAEA